MRVGMLSSERREKKKGDMSCYHYFLSQSERDSKQLKNGKNHNNDKFHYVRKMIEDNVRQVISLESRLAKLKSIPLIEIDELEKSFSSFQLQNFTINGNMSDKLHKLFTKRTV